VVQTFKKGPDYIDPMWLGHASGRYCYNLDFYTMSASEITDKFSQHMHSADIGIIEGNKGLYDGLDLDGSNSNAALAKQLQAPVVLVIDSRGMTRGIAPLVLGYQNFDKDINIRGVILNQVGGSRHESKLRAILEHYTDVTVLGAVHKNSMINIDERHLGLTPSNEDTFADNKIKVIADSIRAQVDLQDLISIAKTAPTEPCIELDAIIDTPQFSDKVKVGIFHDEAFGFYYPDDIDALKNAGADIIYINSLTEKSLPEIDGLFIGGGFPEARMQELSANTSMRNAVFTAIDNGLPTYAECGGLMYLARKIQWQGQSSEMVGVIDGDIMMHDKPQGRGYIQLSQNESHPWPVKTNDKIFAHEFHYSSLDNLSTEYPYAYKVLRGTGINGKEDGLIYKNLLANYAHLRNTDSCPWAQSFIDKIVKINKQK